MIFVFLQQDERKGKWSTTNLLLNLTPVSVDIWKASVVWYQFIQIPVADATNIVHLPKILCLHVTDPLAILNYAKKVLVLFSTNSIT